MNNTTKLGNFISEYSVRNRAGDDIPVYSVTNKEGFCRDYFSKDVASQDRSTYKIVPKGCFAYNPSRINVGSVDWQRKEDRVIVSPLYVVFSVSKELDQQYLYYYLKSEKCLYYIKELASGSVRDNLKLSMLKEFTIPNITLEEQRKAVTVLEQTDRLITLQERQMTVLDELVKSRFFELFYDKGYPVLKWNEVFSTTTGKLDSNAAVVGGEYPFFTCSKETLRIDKYAFEQEALLLAGNNAAGKYDVKYYNGRFNAYQRTYVLELKENWSYRLFQCQLEDKLEYLQQQSLGGLTKYLTLKILGELSFIIPPKELQNEFEVFIAEVDKSKFLIQKSLAISRMLWTLSKTDDIINVDFYAKESLI